MSDMWTVLLSDLFVNLAVGWLGVVLIIPAISGEVSELRFGELTANMIAAILS